MQILMYFNLQKLVTKSLELYKSFCKVILAFDYVSVFLNLQTRDFIYIHYKHNVKVIHCSSKH